MTTNLQSLTEHDPTVKHLWDAIGSLLEVQHSIMYFHKGVLMRGGTVPEISGVGGLSVHA